jgi:hypothetical protein
MKYFLLFGLLPVFICSCQGRKKSLAGDQQVTRQEFIDFFDPLQVPYQLTDDSLREDPSDSSAISYSTFTQFVKDTVLSRHFGKSARPRIYALGKVVEANHETYLFVEAMTSSRKIAYILAIDKSGKFVGSKPLLFADNRPGSGNSALMDTRYTLTIAHNRKGPDGQVFFRRYTYLFNDAGAFQLILTESNETSQGGPEVINPIDTLPRRHKFTGDYILDKRNFVSVRDARDPGRIVFFAHFEKDKGDCRGELKGYARFISPTIAQYRKGGDPCTIELLFTQESVSLKELDPCGNHRDIKCYFDGTYPRRKEPHAKREKKKK